MYRSREQARMRRRTKVSGPDVGETGNCIEEQHDQIWTQ
jgi:hypothetical protein